MLTRFTISPCELIGAFADVRAEERPANTSILTGCHCVLALTGWSMIATNAFGGLGVVHQVGDGIAIDHQALNGACQTGGDARVAVLRV